jgi:hypothetical protein
VAALLTSDTPVSFEVIVVVVQDVVDLKRVKIFS